MKPGQFEDLARLAAIDFESNLLDLEDDAEKAMRQIAKEASENGTKAILSISANVKVAFTADPLTFTTEAGVNIKSKVCRSGQIDDPDQAKLDLEVSRGEGTVTMKLPGRAPVTTTIEKFRDGLEKVTQTDDDKELLGQAIQLVAAEQKASASLLQRRLKIGYKRANWVLERLEAMGAVGPHRVDAPRAVLIAPEKEGGSN